MSYAILFNPHYNQRLDYLDLAQPNFARRAQIYLETLQTQPNQKGCEQFNHRYNALEENFPDATIQLARDYFTHLGEHTRHPISLYAKAVTTECTDLQKAKRALLYLHSFTELRPEKVHPETFDLAKIANILQESEELGQGSYGSVNSYKHPVKNEFYAKKKFHSLASAEKEAKVLSKLDHENIVRIFHFANDEITMECLKGKNIKQALKEATLEEQKEILRQLLSGIAYMNSRGIVHCDLKPDNIKVERYHLADGTPKYRVVIFDFNLAKHLNIRASTPSSIEGTPTHMSPEVFHKIVCPQSDSWAVGIILHEAFTGLHPVLKNADTPIAIQYLLKKHIEKQHPLNFEDLDKTRALPVHLADLIKSLLAIKPENRLTATKALNHPYFTSGSEAAGSAD